MTNTDWLNYFISKIQKTNHPLHHPLDHIQYHKLQYLPHLHKYMSTSQSSLKFMACLYQIITPIINNLTLCAVKLIIFKHAVHNPITDLLNADADTFLALVLVQGVTLSSLVG